MTNPLKNDQILSKIKKCLALSASDNEHEAAQALKHAHALMRQHNIEATDIAKSEILRAESKMTTALTRWHNDLIFTIGNVFCVAHYIDPRWDPDKQKFINFIVFNGKHQNAELAQYAYSVLFRQVNRARSHYIKVNLKRVKVAANKTARANAYAQGYVNSIYQVVREFFTDKSIAERAEIKKLVTQGMSVSKIHTAKPSRKLDFDGDIGNGYQAGKEVKLFKPVHTANNIKSLTLDS